MELVPPIREGRIFSFNAKNFKSQCHALVNRILEYTLRECPEITELMKYYNGLSPEKVTDTHILTESSWIIYSSGFRFDVVRRYWPAIKEAFQQFDVRKVASLSEDLEVQVMNICRISGFKNQRKAMWCIQNAQRIIELDYEKRSSGGLKGYFIKISKKTPYELVKLAPALVGELEFKGIGNTTIFHLMKNLGINIFKPDIHVRRVLAELRLIKCENASVLEICKTMSFLSSVSGMKINELDTLLFVYGKITGDRIHDSERISW
jgi:3-methyladenine DNA glycosylase Tag